MQEELRYQEVFDLAFLPLIEQKELDKFSSRSSSSGRNIHKSLSNNVPEKLPLIEGRRSNSLFNIRVNSRRGSYQTNSFSRRNRSFSLTISQLSTPINRERRLSFIKRENARLLGMKNFSNNNALQERKQTESLQLHGSSKSNADSSIRLEEHIKLRHLQKLLEIFKSHQPPDIQRDEKKEETVQIKQAPGMLTLQEFTTVISEMLGTTKWNDQMEKLFYKVDTGSDDFVDWNEFCTYMLLQMREIEHKQSLKLIPFSSGIIVKQIFQNKQETTTKSVIVENPSRVVTVSKVGSICVWDFELRLLKSYSLSSDVAESQQRTTRRRFHTWVTDMVYMRNTQNLALTTSNREIYFYDISTPTYTIEFCLYALPNVPVCAFYWYNKSARNSHSMLYFGDDTGALHVLHFHTPQSRLFQKPFSPKQGLQRVYFNELSGHHQYVTYECFGNIHNDVVRRVMYVRESNVIISSSMSSSKSVVLMDCEQKKKPYIFKVNKGVECFDYSKSLNILVTGSLDHLVRLWNPYVVAKPITILHGHHTGICDVVVNETYAQIVTYSKDVMIKVWDIKEHTCLQTISPKFPSLQPGRIPEHGEFPLSLYGSPHDVMLATCNDSVALLKMGKLAPKEEIPTTHNAPLSGALYNQLFHQVVTASDDSTVSVWDIETGYKSLTFSNAHAQEEITCLSFDLTNKRLFTGARDGSIKIWNFQNGNCLHELEAVDEAEVTAVIAFQDRTILAVGWSRLISMYDDADPDIVNVSVKTNWKGGQLHKDDILTAAHGYPNLLATGSYDGCILVWNEETQQVYMKLRDGKAGRNSDTKRPVDVLMFLQERARHTKKNRSSLLSSEGGVIYWWCLFGRKSLLGHFHAASSNDGSVLAITSSQDDIYLVTGDTSGYVTVWNIEDYCVTDQNENVVTEKPPSPYQWKAHDRAIVSVSYINHELQPMLVTASTDKTSRLWTLEGRLVGTFGQRKHWNLKSPMSYQYPMDPWGGIVDVPEPGHAYIKYNPLPVEEKAIVSPNLDSTSTNEVNMDTENNGSLSPNNNDIEKQLPDSESNETPDGVSKETFANQTDDLKSVSNSSEKEQVEYKDNDTETSSERENKKRSEESQEANEKKSVLGGQTETVFTNRTTTRKERRIRVGLINEKSTSRFGNLCSPFQALTIRNTESVSFDSKMPMTARMKVKGMKCSNEVDLSKLALHNLLDFNETAEPSNQNRKK